MKGSQPLKPGTPAKVVKSNEETWLVRTDDGGVYRVDAKNLKAVGALTHENVKEGIAEVAKKNEDSKIIAKEKNNQSLEEYIDYVIILKEEFEAMVADGKEATRFYSN